MKVFEEKRSFPKGNKAMKKVKKGSNILKALSRVTVAALMALVAFMAFACSDASRGNTSGVGSDSNTPPAITEPNEPDGENPPTDGEEKPSEPDKEPDKDPENPDDKEPGGETLPDGGDKEPEPDDKDPENPGDKEPGGDKEPDKEEPDEPQPPEQEKSVFEGSWYGWIAGDTECEYTLNIDADGNLTEGSVYITETLDVQTTDIYATCEASETDGVLTITDREDGNKNATFCYADGKIEATGFSGETLSLIKDATNTKSEVLARLEGTYVGNDSDEDGQEFNYVLTFDSKGVCSPQDDSYELYSVRIVNGVITVDDFDKLYELMFDYDNRTLTFVSSPAGVQTVLEREVLAVPPDAFVGLWKSKEAGDSVAYELALNKDGSFSLFKIYDNEKEDISDRYFITYDRTTVYITGKDESYSGVKLVYDEFSDKFVMLPDFTGEESLFERV